MTIGQTKEWRSALPHYRYIGAREYLHVGPPATVLNQGETVWATDNPDPDLFEPAHTEETAGR